MISPKERLLVNRISSADALLVILPETDYGPRNEVGAGIAHDLLAACGKQMSMTFLVLDFSPVRRLSAAFLGRLALVALRQRARRKWLVICGDRWDLVGRTHIDRIMPCFATRNAALIWCAKARASSHLAHGEPHCVSHELTSGRSEATMITQPMNLQRTVPEVLAEPGVGETLNDRRDIRTMER